MRIEIVKPADKVKLTTNNIRLFDSWIEYQELRQKYPRYSNTLFITKVLGVSKPVYYRKKKKVEELFHLWEAYMDYRAENPKDQPTYFSHSNTIPLSIHIPEKPRGVKAKPWTKGVINADKKRLAAEKEEKRLKREQKKLEKAQAEQTETEETQIVL